MIFDKSYRIIINFEIYRSLVFGGIDGIISSLVIMSGAAGNIKDYMILLS